MWKLTDSTIQPWPRKYYLGLGVQHRTDVCLNNYRCYFLQIVEKRTPEVVEDLAAVILPVYSRHFWSAHTKASKSNLTMDLLRYHRLMARSWVKGSQDVWWSYFEPVRDLLLSWAEWYQITSDWVLQRALNAMLHWTRHSTTFDKFGMIFGKEWTTAERDAYASRLTPEQRDQFLNEFGMREKEIREAVVELPTYRSEPARSVDQLRKFEYPTWDGQDEKRYFAIVRAAFDRHLKSYRGEVEAQAKSLDKVEKITKPERFDMLVLYLCYGLTCSQIADTPGIPQKDKTGIYRDVKQAAELVGLPVRKRGQPRTVPPRPSRWSATVESLG